MKLILRLLNVIIMAISLTATIFLFTAPSLSFNSNIAIDVKTFSKFVPETQYSSDFDITKMLGTDTIHVGIKFSLKVDGVKEIMNGDRDAINQRIISDNVDDMLKELHTPVDLITDFSIRSIIKSIVKEQITQQIDNAREEYQKKSGQELESTTPEIMEEVGIDDVYFTNFAYALYDSADAEDATVDSVTNTLYEQIDEALIRAENYIDSSSYNDTAKDSIKNSLVSTLTELKLVQDGGKVTRISQISYMYLSDYLKKELQNKGVSESLEREVGETYSNYSDRLLRIFVFTQIPDMFYQAVGYVSLALLIGLFVFAGIWIILFLITLIKTFTRKPWTIFGFWFWFFGLFQLVLGLGLTVAGKFILPQYFDVSTLGLPIKSILIAPRTYALVPSILYLGCIVLAIIYLFFKIPAKHEYKAEMLRGRH